MDDMFEGDDGLLRRYLLGELGQEEEDHVEQRLLHENRLFRRAELVEGELLAAYARGELTPAQRDRVRRWSASPGGHAKLALAQGLTKIAAEPAAPVLLPFRPPVPAPPPARVWPRSLATLAAGLLLVVGSIGGWMAWENRDRAHETRAEIQPSTPAPPVEPSPAAAPTPQETPPPAPRQPSPTPGVTERIVTQTFALAFTTITRSAGEAEEEDVLSIAEGTGKVDFQVQLDPAGKDPFEVTLTTEADEEAFQAKGLELVPLGSGKRGIRFEVPVDKLPAGPYTITVQEAGDADSMPLIKMFEIRKQS